LLPETQLNNLDLNLLTIESARTAVQERQITATALAENFFRKIGQEDGEIHAYLNLAKERALAQGTELSSQTPEQFAAFLAAQEAKWEKVAKAAGMRAD